MQAMASTQRHTSSEKEEPTSDDSTTPQALDERAVARALVELSDSTKARYDALAQTASDVRRDLRDHVAKSKVDHDHLVKLTQSIGDGVFELGAALHAKDKIDMARMDAWKAELSQVAAQAGRNAADAVAGDESARQQLDSVSEVVETLEVQAIKHELEVKKASELATRAMNMATIRLGVIVAVILTTYKVVSYLLTKGWLLP
jgi:hypothetical protein